MTKSKENFVISQGMYMIDLGTQMYRSRTQTWNLKIQCFKAT